MIQRLYWLTCGNPTRASFLGPVTKHGARIRRAVEIHCCVNDWHSDFTCRSEDTRGGRNDGLGDRDIDPRPVPYSARAEEALLHIDDNDRGLPRVQLECRRSRLPLYACG